MTVKELIEKLKQYDENNDVIIDESCLSDNLDNVHGVALVQCIVIDKDGNEASINQVVIYWFLAKLQKSRNLEPNKNKRQKRQILELSKRRLKMNFDIKDLKSWANRHDVEIKSVTGFLEILY